MSFFAGERLTASLLNQTYGQADTVQSVITGTSFLTLSSVYTIPAGEPQAGSAYELECAGYGTMGSSGGPALTFAMSTGGATFGGLPTVGGATFNASQPFRYWLKFKLVCQDGVSSWWCSLAGNLAESGSNYNNTTGTETYAIADANTSVRTQSVSSSISVAIQAKWSGGTGPTITNTLTTWRKVA